MKEMS